MFWIKQLFALYFALSTTSSVAETMSQIVAPNQLVIQVKGIVCSFCAYGTEKNLAKLDFLDTGYYGNGVLIDIKTHRVTLALNPDQLVDYYSVSEAILKGGYDPKAYFTMLSGVIKKTLKGYQLISRDNGQIFALPSTFHAAPLMDQTVVLQTEFTADQAINGIDGEIFQLTIVELESLP